MCNSPIAGGDGHSLVLALVLVLVLSGQCHVRASQSRRADGTGRARVLVAA